MKSTARQMRGLRRRHHEPTVMIAVPADRQRELTELSLYPQPLLAEVCRVMAGVLARQMQGPELTREELVAHVDEGVALAMAKATIAAWQGRGVIGAAHLRP